MGGSLQVTGTAMQGTLTAVNDLSQQCGGPPLTVQGQATLTKQ
jgi:hypothetical protein